MASRDPRADIIDSNPFPKPKIKRIHSSPDNNQSSNIFTIDELRNMFNNNFNSKPNQQEKKVWEYHENGYGYGTIAKIMNMSRSMVQRIIKGVNK